MKEKKTEFFIEACVMDFGSGSVKASWIESDSYVYFMGLIQNLQKLKNSDEPSYHVINPEIDPGRINQIISKKSIFL